MIHWSFTTIAVVMAVCLVAIVCLLVSRKWGSAALLTACALVSALLVADLLVQLFGMRDETSYAAEQFNYAGTMLKMYETGARFEVADARTRDMLRPKLLESCRSVDELQSFLPSYEPIPAEFRKLRCVDWSTFPRKNLEAAQRFATLWLAAESPNALERVTSFSWLVASRTQTTLYDKARVWSLIDRRTKGSAGNPQVVADYLGRDSDRVVSYVLSGWYVARQHYGDALNRLVAALGREWLSNGKVDKWWAANLPPRSQDHLYFGYVLFKNGSESVALREFRLSVGHQNANLQQMNATYDRWPLEPKHP